jgi:DNA-binding NtrC family response regulator
MNREKQITPLPLSVRRTRTGDARIFKGRKKSVNLDPSHDRQKAASALLVYTEFEPMHTLRVALASQGIDTWRARSCRHALTFLAKFRPVDAIFTDQALSDGTWLDLARAKRRPSAPLIVVASEMDARLLSDIIQQGGAGLIVPPFATADLIYPVRRSSASRCSNQQNGSFESVRDDPRRSFARRN